MVKKYLLLLFMLCCLFMGNAQPKQLCFEHLNVRTGLPSDHVLQILQDEKGYLWFNTSPSLSRYDGYKFKAYKLGKDRNEMIPDGGIFLDRNKRLWIGTDHGNLFRLDTVRDTLIRERYVSGKERVLGYYFFFSDKQNKIWHFRFSYSVKAQFLEQYDPDKKRTRQFNTLQKGNEFLDSGLIMTNPFVTTSGDVFFGSRNGFYEYNFKTGNFQPFLNSPDSSSNISVVDLAENKNDTSLLWLLAKHLNEQQLTLYLFNKHDKTAKACTSIRGTVERFAKSLYEDKKGRLWLVFKEGLYQYNRQTNYTTAYPFPSSDTFAKEQYYAEIKVDDNEGNLWLKTFSGLLYFNTSTGAFQRYMANPSNPDALAHNHVTDIFEDKSGLIWVGMDEYGVDRVNNLKSSFRTLKYNSLQPGSYPENTTGLAQRPDGNYWLTTLRGIFEWDTKKNYFRKIKLENKDENQFTSHPVCLNNGDFYFTNSQELCVYSSTGKLESYKLPGNNDINGVFTNSDGELWVLSGRGNLYQFDHANHSFNLYSFIDISGKNATPDTAVEADFAQPLYEDRQGVLWMSIPKAGLCRVDHAKKTVITSPLLQGSTFKDIIQMYDDVEGNFWIGTRRNGLWLFDRKTGKLLKQIMDKEELLLGTIAGIAEDRSGNIWVSTERGLTKINLKNNAIFSYTVANNIPFDAIVINSLIKTKSGEFLLWMFNSLIRFNPDEITPNTVPPVVQIESIVYSNPQAKQPDEHLVNAFNQTVFRLPYYHNRIIINFVGLHYVNALHNQYSYKLDGFDNNWVQAGTEHKVTYNNLDPDTYTFHVKAANSDGVWSTKDVSITIIITPPWWKTWWAYLLYALLLAAAIRGYVVYRSRALRQENRRLEQKVAQRTQQVELQKEEIAAQRDSLEDTLSELKSTQAQLIQSEKMASLGQLTAGIAHEIQNPLNFVNNFSEINTELLNELEEEAVKGNIDEVKCIAKDLKDNEQKIILHGKRADSIVKGMLQHSRASTGKKEFTDINALIDECMRLTYHGMRAKDKEFNATIKTEFDEGIGKINIVPQDTSRVLLNLLNNAFYAVDEKKRQLDGMYEPTVSVCTKKLDGKVEIHVKDNGNGIPQNIVDKIFQPFFTTKPTGQGTGLGLSLSYDIVKAHGGEIRVDSKEGEGSEFVIRIPV